MTPHLSRLLHRSWYNRVQVLSDLHFEIGQQYAAFTLPVAAPYLLLAGDIGRLVDYSGYLSLLAAQAARFEAVLVVLGNHEFCGMSHAKRSRRRSTRAARSRRPLRPSCWPRGAARAGRPTVRAWVFGHTHHCTDMVCAGVRVMANQRRYVLPGMSLAAVKGAKWKKRARTFDPAKVVVVR
ncbi:Ser/Thr protein phosphatase [Cordyceps fumosorosea ARSEF 2679]|uniref:Ser/Thr protein phosphatase n=1 Tax=Cordyceps fumosorosea (strain ARSEF 2679) TaxID=1081104 RepID=A0A167QKU5_CORFA|nr:Ser/Thr protein phosphatase [Cordyceps fumosorosea ARSEF 2679]OAA57730.1 Ser/Thr protein phosphatase [Cordyceps fumosorosea ARSEF 2679]